MTALVLPTMPELIAARDRWEACDAGELLASPWRTALGVWWVPHEGYSTHPRGWRWIVALSSTQRITITNDRLEQAANAKALRDVELGYLLAAAELEQIERRELVSIVQRREASGTAIGAQAARLGAMTLQRVLTTGKRQRLAASFESLGLALERVEVRP